MSKEIIKETLDDCQNFLDDELYVENFHNFKEYKTEILENFCRGYYIITVTLENGDSINHKFLFVDKRYEDLILYPIEIPKENMFNTTQNIVDKEYNYIKFNKNDYHTKRNELVDFDGNIRKKQKGEVTVNDSQINFLVKPLKGYEFEKYYSSIMKVHINNFSDKYKELMKRHLYNGLCEIVLILKSGEHINLYFRLNGIEDNMLSLKPLWEDAHIRNLNNIPQEYILYKNFKFFSYSRKIDYLNEYSQHMYEQHCEDEFICVNTSNFSTEVLSAIKEFQDKGKLLYTFIANIEGNIKKNTEVYEFIKFKKSYQWKYNYVILKTIKLPVNSWNKTDLSDIRAEKWEYIIG